jgi:regulator of protease activity HflC (stomatin/prohibitin superfamily)
MPACEKYDNWRMRMTFKRKVWALLVMVGVLALSMSSAACGRTVIAPGHVGIVVNSYGTDKGVSSYPVVTGVTWYNPITTSILEYPTFVQTAKWTKDPNEGSPVNEETTFTTGDQMVVSMDLSLSYHLVTEKVPAFYVKFRSDDINAFTHGFLRNIARDKCNERGGKYKIEQIMGDNADFLTTVRADIQKEIEPFGVVLDQFGPIGAPRPPQAVIESINAKVQATQLAITAENQLRQAEAEAKKRVAAAEGEAKANTILSNSINPNLLEWQRLDIQRGLMFKWNGVLPIYTGGTMPLLQLPGPGGIK